MPESYFRLSARDKSDALNAASAVSGRPPHLLEKDIWVVWSLAALFESQFGSHLVFKGGTALSKAYNVIRRFSEDVDLTYDIRALAPQLVGNAPEGVDAIPPSRSQEKKWSDGIRRELLPAWLRDSALAWQRRKPHGRVAKEHRRRRGPGRESYQEARSQCENRHQEGNWPRENSDQGCFEAEDSLSTRGLSTGPR